MELVRSSDDAAIFRDATADDGKLVFTDFRFNVPVVDPSDSQVLEMLKGLKDPKPYAFSYACTSTS